MKNIEEVGEFVVNFSTVELMHLVNESSANFAPEIDEALTLGVAMEDSELVRPRRVRDSPAAMECRVRSTERLGNSTLILGTVQAIAVSDSLFGPEGEIDDSRLQGVSRLAGNQWGLPPKAVTLQRPVG